MTPLERVNQLAEGLPGPDSKTMDEIMSILQRVADSASNSARVPNSSRGPDYDPYEHGRDLFVKEVNPLLEPYRIRYSSNNDDFRHPVKGGEGYRMSRGFVGSDAVAVMRAPRPINSSAFGPYARVAIAHELVHVSQILSTRKTGNLGKMGRTRKPAPEGTSTHDQYAHYASHQAETPAFAKGDVENKKATGLGRQAVMQSFKTDPKSNMGGQWLKNYDTKAYNRYLKHAAGYAEQIPETMNAQNIVSTLLEDLPGASPETLDAIMQVIKAAAEHARQGGPSDQQQRFENEVNPQLEQYGITFTHTNQMLNSHVGAPAYTDLDGIFMRTPAQLGGHTFEYLKTIISHELVHADQIFRAHDTGSAEEMVAASRRRILPNGDNGPIDWKAYKTNPHEVTAYARTHIDGMGDNTTRDQALQMLKRDAHSSKLKDVDRKSHQRFMKHAAGYAEQLPKE